MEEWYIESSKVERYNLEENDLFIYQRVRATDNMVINLDKHLDILKTYTEILMPQTPLPTAKEIEQMCQRLLLRGGYSASATLFLDIRIWQSGKVRISVVGTSIYKQFSLRVLRPKAALIEGCSTPLLYPTSAEISCNQLLQNIVRQSGCDIAIAVDNRQVTAVESANPIAVHGTRVTISKSISSVYTDMVFEALQKLPQYEVSIEPLTVQLLSTADEIFYADYRGITAVGTLGEKHYSDSVAYAISKVIGS